jgi:HlyD family secretion protein
VKVEISLDLKGVRGKASRLIGKVLGKKNPRTDEPTQRVDTRIIETLIEHDPGAYLPVGLRVEAFIEVGR